MYRTLAVADAEKAVDANKTDYMVWLRIRTADIAGSGAQSILSELANLGFAWRDIARMVGVSVPAIQKWRKGDKPSGDNALKLAQLLAGCEAIRMFNPVITDVALWFEVPVVPEAPVTPIDLWASGNQQLVLEHARVGSEVDPYDTMDSFDAQWREKYRSDFETFVAGDGEVSIRMRER